MSAERQDYRTAEEKALKRFALTTKADELPDPPENPDFLELPELQQAVFVNRFEAGIALARRINAETRAVWLAQVGEMLDRRREAHDRELARRVRAREKYMANRATVGDLAGRHGKR